MQIRCVAWSPIITHEADHQNPMRRPQKNPFILAISQNSNSKVSLLRVSSPYLSHKCAEWSISEIGSFNVSKQVSGSEAASLLDQQLGKAGVVDFIEFGPTQIDSSKLRTIISCRCLGNFSHFAVRMNTAIPYEPLVEIVAKHEILELRDDVLFSQPALWLKDKVCCICLNHNVVAIPD